MDTTTRMQDLGKVLSDNAQKAKALDATMQFVVDGTHYLVNLRDEVGVTEKKSKSADCTVKMSGEDFASVMDGTANVQQLFFSGRLAVEGDLSVLSSVSKLVVSAS